MKIDTCYTPAALATPEDLQKKKEIFERRERTVSPLNFLLMILPLMDVDTLATPQFLACRRDPETWEERSIFA
jgi:hypothetical protein